MARYAGTASSATPIPTNKRSTEVNSRGYTNLFGTRTALPPRYFGNIAYYLAVAAHGGDAYMDGSILFDKRQKAVHRCEIADTRGRVQLTAPVAKPHGIARATWDDVAVSPHGQWWHIHLTTLESAYGRTPFFEFYIDRLCPFLLPDTHLRYPSIVALDRAIDAELRRILFLPEAPEPKSSADTAEAAGMEHSDTRFTDLIEPYWQVRMDSLGFQPNLSILDLIFNLGPEAAIYLWSIASKAQSTRIHQLFSLPIT